MPRGLMQVPSFDLRLVARSALATGLCVTATNAASVAWNQTLTLSPRNYEYGIDLDRTSGRVFIAGQHGSAYARLDAFDANSGAVLWGKTLTNPATGMGVGVATRTDGSAQIVGYTHFPINGVNGPGYENTFIGRYGGATGTPIATIELSSDADDYSTDIAIDLADNSYVSGFANGPLGAPSVGQHDAFLAKHDAGGTLQWIRKLGTAAVDVGRATAVDRSGNVYLAGETEGVVPGKAALGGGRDGFVQKYDTSGNLLWQRPVGTNAFDSFNAMATDAADNVYALTQAYVNNAPRATLTKLDATGTTLWSHEYGSSINDTALIAGLAIDDAGRLYMAGTAIGSFAGPTLGGSADAFVAQLAANGDIAWSFKYGTSATDHLMSLVSDGAGALYATGYIDNIDTSGTVKGFVTRIDVPEPSVLASSTLALALTLTRRTRRRR